MEEEVERAMTTVALRFPAGRFHATPWGRHVNEGAPEWPPSPWRLLRSLIAVWKMRSAELSEDEVRPILEALATPPEFLLPPAALAHTRHYMPLGLKKEVEQRTKVFDAFISVERDRELLVSWPDIVLDDPQREILARLLDRLGYFGRAESWCEARLVDSDTAHEPANCRPLGDDAAPAAGEELVRVLCPDPASAFSDEHVRAKKKRPVYEPCWNLAIETAQLHAEKWSDPPGSHWVTYVRRSDCFHPRPAVRVRRAARPCMQVARYALDSNVLPLSTVTLPFAETVRSALMSRTPNREPSAVFSGKDADGLPLQGHGHAYFLPADEDGDGRLDHVTVFAREGFGEREVHAIDQLRMLKSGGDEHEVRLLLMAIAKADQLKAPLLGPACEWVSLTPYIATRHPKKNGVRADPLELLNDPRRFVKQDLRRELARLSERLGLPAPEIDSLLDDAGVFRLEPSQWASGARGPTRRALEFKRFRSRKRTDDGGRRLSGFFKLHFPQPVSGPIALGHSAHFGMGLFMPVVSDPQPDA